MEELILCVRQLMLAPNAPILERAQQVLEGLIAFLQPATSVGRAHPDAFAAINSVMSRTSLDNGILTERSTLQLIPLIKDFWSLKTTSLKDEIPDAEAFVSDVESLMDVLYTDYSKRSDRDLLQVDELDLVTESDLTARRRALRTAAFCLRTGNLRSESQAACHIMDITIRLGLVSYASIADSARSIISSIDLNGPVLLADSVSSMWVNIIRMQSSENPSGYSAVCERVLQWLFRKWVPSAFEDRTYASQIASNTVPGDIVRLLCACTDRPWTPACGCLGTGLGLVAQTWLQHTDHVQLSTYLLLLNDDNPSTIDLTKEKPGTRAEPTESRNRSTAADSLMLDFCISEVNKVLQTLSKWKVERPQNISGDVIRIATSLCMIVGALTTQPDLQDTRRINSLQTATDALAKAVAELISRQDCEQAKVDASLEVVASSLPGLSSIRPSQTYMWDTELIKFAVHFSTALELRRKTRVDDPAEDGFDPMELDDGFESQTGHSRSNMDGPNVPRSDVAAETDASSVRASVAAYLYLVASQDEIPEEAKNQKQVPTSFVRHVVSLPDAQVLGCRSFLADLGLSGFLMTATDAEVLLEFMAETFLRQYEHERSEVAIGTILDVMAGFAPLWTDSKATSLYELGLDIYEWVVTIALRTGISSPNVQIHITNLLHSLLKVDPEYGQSASLPSVRTSLFGVLQEGEIPVKYHVAERISEIFGLFVLSKHDAIFDDVHNSLPKDIEWSEGIALRLLVFARLASAWYTLLRRCIYHTFETAGLVEGSEAHATRCIIKVAAALGLEDPNALFQLFASQLLYTWLETRPIAEIPYSIFNYPTLSALLGDVQDEAFAQLVMRGKDDEAPAFATRLDVAVVDLLQQNFAKTTSYCIAWDIRTGVVQQSSLSTSEARVRSYIGTKDQYLSLIEQHFSEILGQMFLSMQQEEQVEKAFQKRAAYSDAATRLQEIKRFSFSVNSLPLSQQPSFKAKYLLDQIERLCRRTNRDPTRLWTPAILTRVTGMLLDTIHPALGSLQACSVIRRLRVVVAMAGDVALEGYPLEMLLHALRPFLTNAQCADDALGLVQYLLHHGRAYLAQLPSFVAGLLLLILILLRTFLSSSQDSTTQESQHRATISKAQAFHSWLAEYIEKIEPETLQEPSRNAFLSMLRAARDVRSDGSFVNGSAEGRLLRELLDDERSGRRLLSQSSLNASLNLFCANFHVPPSSREDIFGSDVDSSAYATYIWKSCQRDVVSEGYILWVARIVGRAYGSHGGIDISIPIPFHDLKRLNIRNEKEALLQSKSAITRHLVELLSSDNRKEVGLAEMTIRSIMSRFTDAGEAAEFEQVLPSTVVFALSLGHPDRAMTALPNKAAGTSTQDHIKQQLVPREPKSLSQWAQGVTTALALSVSDEAIVGTLPKILQEVQGLAENFFPYILHLVLAGESDRQQNLRREASEACRYWFQQSEETAIPHVRLLITSILYLRTQEILHETTKADRNRWLELDYVMTAEAAAMCGMYKAALLFAETHASSTVRNSRRSSVSAVAPKAVPTKLLLDIFRNVDDPDSFYGVQQPPNLESVMDRLDYEVEGFKSLSFRGARLDSQMRRLKHITPMDSRGTVRSLTALNLDSLTHTLLSNTHFRSTGDDAVNSMLYTARKLEQWDIRAPESNKTDVGAIFRAFQSLNNATDILVVRGHVDQGLLAVMQTLRKSKNTGVSLHSSLTALAILVEIDEVVGSNTGSHLQDTWENMQSRQHWMQFGRYEDVRQILSSRETLFSSLSSNKQLQTLIHTGAKEARTIEIEALLASSSLSRQHRALQESLTTITYISDLGQVCNEVEMDVRAATQLEMASVMWDQGEMTTSIQMLQGLMYETGLEEQTIPVARSGLLVQLGHQMAEARMEKPDEIIDKYLKPAITELKGQSKGLDAGRVFHEFASFCDRQLQNSDTQEDFARITKMREHKAAEVEELEHIIAQSRNADEKRQLKHSYVKAKTWLDIDDLEYQRLRQDRETFMRSSLENYLLSLQACEDYNTDVLRFFALWLEYSDTKIANEAVKGHLQNVPSRKFAVLMNQLSSRLQNDATPFQLLLASLVLRTCVDHPHHGMYHLYAGVMSKGSKDEASMSRSRAARSVLTRLQAEKRANHLWNRIFEANGLYINLAMSKDESKKKMAKIPVSTNPAAAKMANRLPSLKVPPATLTIELREDLNYNNVPRIVRLDSHIRMAGGLSAPKILSVIGSDGVYYKQLYKGGNDDLRQDAIMEQVFDQVSKMLKKQRTTRQRNLKVRTYNVVPLTSHAGVMEFVQNSIPLGDFLNPAHATYYPKDVKGSVAREKINSVRGSSVETRTKMFRRVCEAYNPVLRHFFLERFDDPEEWFDKRLAYTRSTAAISILGHVLGLGDRHCHNILLDEESGEVVHIDLGVAFEAGRVLPVPEVVPFRLTRDIVDGMGITKTEGVFRRCCEFTLDALREERDSIMTILNVLRYDPLYSWTVSPIKAKRMQEAQEGLQGATTSEVPYEASKKKENDAGEADRALSIVEKKLSKTLSTAATVNELIQQASDERNLAVLFSGKSQQSFAAIGI
ncbi:hypothetical protein LTR04_001989 [Oleoguttula sp. CCFEE 6159]|nr:hypothetical protein LTR04_001989 [Oleoguttula sp. CCFEE 6159]